VIHGRVPVPGGVNSDRRIFCPAHLPAVPGKFLPINHHPCQFKHGTSNIPTSAAREATTGGFQKVQRGLVAKRARPTHEEVTLDGGGPVRGLIHHPNLTGWGDAGGVSLVRLTLMGRCRDTPKGSAGLLHGSLPWV